MSADQRNKLGAGGMLSGAGASILGAPGFKAQERPVISINLEDVILHEEKLNNILEVSSIVLCLTMHPFYQ